MSNIITRVPRTRQPPYNAGPDRSKGASALWAFAAPADQVSGRAVAAGSGASYVPGQSGQHLRVAGTGSLGRATLQCGSADKPGSGDFTALIRFIPRAGSIAYVALGRWNSGASAGSNDWYLGDPNTFSSSGVTFSVECGTTVYSAATSGPWTFGNEYTLIGVRRGTTISVYRYAHADRSIVTASTTNAGITTINGNSARALTLGELDVGASYNLDLDASVVALFPRALAPSEIDQAYTNPWAFLDPATRRIWVPVSAGGAITIDCTPGNAVAAGTAATIFIAQTLACSVGNATAAGVAATVSTAQTVACAVGNAVAAGPAATLTTDQTIAASVGNAVAAGVSATIDIGGVVSIDCTVGNATAAGIAAAIDATDAVIESAANRGAGKSRSRKRRYTVEVNGEEYSVESAEEALAVLNKAKEAAQEAADLALTRAVKATKRPLRKVLADARKTMEAPHIVAPPAFEFLVDDIARQIDEIYSRTINSIEIAARLAIQRRAEEEDDEDILLLL